MDEQKYIDNFGLAHKVVGISVSTLTEFVSDRIEEIGDVIGEGEDLSDRLEDTFTERGLDFDGVHATCIKLIGDSNHSAELERDLAELRDELNYDALTAFSDVVKARLNEMALELAVFEARVERMINDQHYLCGQLAVALERGEYETVRDELLKFGQLYERHSQH